MSTTGEELRNAMRKWVTGVSVVSSISEGIRHGMTVNSFTSISLDPPIVTVTLANDTRTYQLVMRSGVFGLTVLSNQQQFVSDRFAGRDLETSDRFEGMDTFQLQTGCPLITGGLAFLDCRVVHTYPMPLSTLFIGEVIVGKSIEATNPLIYFNRNFFHFDL
jgi:flavin reductase (DIM6/NTAB) family NADH-FMN oxidoreductase RutF